MIFEKWKSLFFLWPDNSNWLCKWSSQDWSFSVDRQRQYSSSCRGRTCQVWSCPHTDFLILNINHLNTKHLKSKHLTFWTLFCLVFKWSDHMIRLTIPILDISNHKTDTFVWFLDQHFTSGHVWTIQIPNLSSIQMVTLLIIYQHISTVDKTTMWGKVSWLRDKANAQTHVRSVGWGLTP